MMPRSVTVRVNRPNRRPIRVWVPVLPVVLVFLPVLTLAALVGAVACLAYRVSVAGALGVGWRVVAALPGTRIDLERRRAALLVSIR